MSKTLPITKTAEQVLSKLFSRSDLKIFSQQAQVVLMAGMPGSGKSTISELLVSAYGYWRFSSDQIRMEELFPGQPHRVANQHEKVMAARQKVYEELSKRIVAALKRGQKVVVDSTNLENEKRELLIHAIKAVVPPEKIAFAIVETPEKVMKNRFLMEGEASAQKWLSVYEYWRNFLAEGKASFPKHSQYPGVHLCRVRRFDLETFDWITQIGVIVWDVDKTLYTPHPKINALISAHHIEKIQNHLGISKVEAQKKFDDAFQSWHSSTLSLDALGLDGRQVNDEFFLNLPIEKYIQPDPRLKKLFAKLSQFHHVILSNGGRKATERKLEALGLPLKIFSAIYATFELPVVKPDPRVFQHVIHQTNFAPHQHLMVGDEVKKEILPAKGVGMRTALIGSQSVDADVSFATAHGVGRLFGVEV